MKSEVLRVTHELQAMKDKIKENTEKIKVNKTLPYLVSNVIEVSKAVVEGVDDFRYIVILTNHFRMPGMVEMKEKCLFTSLGINNRENPKRSNPFSNLFLLLVCFCTTSKVSYSRTSDLFLRSVQLVLNLFLLAFVPSSH